MNAAGRWFLSVVLLVAMPLGAQTPTTAEQSAEDVRAALQHAGRARFERNQPRVRGVFADVVKQANLATVRILEGSKQRALGAIYDADGFILTKASELPATVVCELHDGRKLAAKVVGVHAEYDLAALKVEARQLPTIRWRDTEPDVGNWLATPGQKGPPVSIGIVSVRPRPIAAPKAVLGIVIEQHDLGPRIVQIMQDGGAHKAGLRAQDVITHLNGQRVATRDLLIELVSKFRPGDRVSLIAMRDERPLSVLATLSPLSQLDHEERLNFQNGLGGHLSERREGFPLALQHDTVLKPEECGGPLVDLDGRAVGINIARAGRTASYALPATRIVPLLDELKSGRLAPDQELNKTREQLAARWEQLQQMERLLNERTSSLEATLRQLEANERPTAQTARSVEASVDQGRREVAVSRQAVEQSRRELEKVTREMERLRLEIRAVGSATSK